jgi:transcriptional regulator with XRE-family HTH domain
MVGSVKHGSRLICWFWEASADVGKIPKKFGRIIRSRRKAAGWSQEALADEAGLHRTYVGMIERGERTPTIVVVKQLATALGTTMVDLIRELESEKP